MILGIFIVVAIIGSVAVVMYFNYQNEVLIQNSKKELLEKEQKYNEKVAADKKTEEYNKKAMLDTAIATAKTNRTNLWNTNDKDGDGKVDSDIAKWIEDRYNQEVQIATERYK